MHDDAHRILWDSVKDSLYCTREEYLKQLEGWEVEDVRNGDVVVAIRINKGPEFHFVMTGEARSVTRSDVAACIQPLIDTYGFAETRTPIDDTRQQRFNELIGFLETGRDEFDIHYRIDKMQHIRRQSCQQQA